MTARDDYPWLRFMATDECIVEAEMALDEIDRLRRELIEMTIHANVLTIEKQDLTWQRAHWLAKAIEAADEIERLNEDDWIGNPVRAPWGFAGEDPVEP